MKKFPKSSMITWYDYDSATKRLHVCFNDGKVGFYENIPYKLYTELNLMAISKGKFLAKEIKGRFKWQQEEEPQKHKKSEKDRLS